MKIADFSKIRYLPENDPEKAKNGQKSVPSEVKLGYNTKKLAQKGPKLAKFEDK